MNDIELNRRELTGNDALRFAREAGMEEASKGGLFYAGVGDLIRFARLVRAGWNPVAASPSSKSTDKPVALVIVREGAEDEFFWQDRGALLELKPGEYDLYLAPSSKSTKEADDLADQIRALPAIYPHAHLNHPDNVRWWRSGFEAARKQAAELALASSSTKEDGGEGERLTEDEIHARDWWCPHCKMDVPPEMVTKDGEHYLESGGCGRAVRGEPSSPPSPLGDTPEQQEQKR